MACAIRNGELTIAKLTLSVDEAVVEKAKQLAEANHTSVSAMFSRFVLALSAPQSGRPKIGPLTRTLTGILDLPPGKDYKELPAEALAEEHGVQ